MWLFNNTTNSIYVNIFYFLDVYVSGR